MAEPHYSKLTLPIATPVATAEVGMGGTAAPYNLQYHDGVKVVTVGGLVYSFNGTDGNPIIATYTGTTASNGTVTFNISAAGFTTLHTATPSAVRNTSSAAQFIAAFVVNYSPTSVKVQVVESKTTSVFVGGSVEGLEAAPAGISVMLTCMGI